MKKNNVPQKKKAGLLNKGGHVMDLKSCYLRLGGDYDEVLGRLHKESLVEKFIFKIFDDRSFRQLE